MCCMMTLGVVVKIERTNVEPSQKCNSFSKGESDQQRGQGHNGRQQRGKISSLQVDDLKRYKALRTA